MMLQDHEDGRSNNVSQGFTGRFFAIVFFFFFFGETIRFPWVLFFFFLWIFFFLFPPHNSKVEDLSLQKNRTHVPR